MHLLFLVRRWSVYLLLNLLIFLLGYIFVLNGTFVSRPVLAQTIVVSIGASLIAAAIVAFLDLWKDVMRSDLLDRIRGVVVDAGVEAAYRKRDLDRYDALMQDLAERLDITGYSLNAFYESFAELVASKLSTNPALKVRILVVKPDSVYAANRAEQEGKARDAFVDSISRVHRSFGTFPEVQIRELNAPLTTMIFRIDDVMFVGPHFHRKPSKGTITLELRRDGWAFAEYEKEFDRLWGDAYQAVNSP